MDDNYYDWEKIINELDDEEKFNALYDEGCPTEKRNAAEKILLQQGLIVKNEKGKYKKEEIEERYIEFVSKYLKKVPAKNMDAKRVEAIQRLTRAGLNNASAKHLVDFYILWRGMAQKDKHLKTLHYVAHGFLLTISGTGTIVFYSWVSKNFFVPLVVLIILAYSVNLVFSFYAPRNFESYKIFKVITNNDKASLTE